MSVSPLSARTRPHPGEAANVERPFVSVIVPIRNEEGFIGATLSELVAQDYDPNRYEIIVVDGNSTDQTVAVVEDFAARHPQVRLLHNPRRWSSAARNLGVLAARGKYLLVVDAHCELRNPHYLDELVDAFERCQADCIGRPQPLDVAGASRLQQAIAAARSSFLGHHPASFIYSAVDRMVPAHSVGVAYRHDVFDRLGLFDERFDACEDVEFNHRVDQAGLRCFLASNLRVKYHPRSSLKELVRQMFRYGRGRGRLFRKHPGTFSWGSFLPAAFVAGLVLGPLLTLWAPWLGWVYLAGISLYVAIVLTVSLFIALGHPQGAALAGRLPLVFAAIHLGAGAGVVEELCCGPFRQPAWARWEAEARASEQALANETASATAHR